MTDQRDAIEFADPRFETCECCGGTTTRLTRFVSREGGAFAVYFAKYANNHPDRYVSLLVGFGDWDEDAAPDRRTAIAFRIWTTGKNYQVGIVDFEDDGWETEYLGRRLTREEALTSPWKQEMFDLSDHIVECDVPIIEYLNNEVPSSL